ncbi:OmpH family outer membrane protein [Parvibium lacunae]|uniref:OmpH family outer membrane protein n=1 Tax=Parvibium lacunae TaxID=1888893 RepID=A0A368L8G4_9BURK|nr:OmpH family outer membrane protein [Parvibium lacunae]
MKFLSPILLLAVISTTTVAQESGKIGFVDTEKILRESTPAKAATEKIDREFSKRQKELQDMGNRLKTLSEKFDKDSLTMTERDRNAKQRELAEMDRDLQRRGREFQEDLNQRRQEEYNALIQRANKVIAEFAEKEKFDIIFQEAVYRNPKIDITDRVLKILNATPSTK